MTLTAEEAAQEFKGKPILAKGIVKDRAELIQKLGYKSEDVVVATPSGFEKLAWQIASISFILIAVGIGGFYFEMNSPGFGVGGIISLIAFGIFFFGNFIAGNLAGYEVVAVFILGAVLVVVELFLFPSIIIGVVGGCMMLGSLFYAMISRFDLSDIKEEKILPGDGVSLTEMISGPLTSLSIGLVGGMLLILLMMRYLHMVPLKGFVLNKELGDEIKESALTVNGSDNSMIGSEGVALMDLRPVGKIEVDGKTLDVITRGEFIEKGQRVRILAKEQMRTIVEIV